MTANYTTSKSDTDTIKMENLNGSYEHEHNPTAYTCIYEVGDNCTVTSNRIKIIEFLLLE